MKRWFPPIALAAGLAAGVGSVFAQQQPPQPVDPEPIPWNCPNFGVSLTLTGSSGTLQLPDGRFIFTSPNLRVTVTADNGNSVSYVITGASHVETLPDGNLRFVSTGRNLLLVPDVPGQHPVGLFLTVGNVTFVVNPTTGAEVETFSGTGKVVDVCQLLA